MLPTFSETNESNFLKLADMFETYIHRYIHVPYRVCQRQAANRGEETRSFRVHNMRIRLSPLPQLVAVFKY